MKIKPDKLKNVNKIYREVGPYLGLGMQLAITVTVMVFLGIWLDEKFDLSPVLTIVFAMQLVYSPGCTILLKVLLILVNDIQLKRILLFGISFGIFSLLILAMLYFICCFK